MVMQINALSAFFSPILGSLVYTAFGLKRVMYAGVVCFFFTACFECLIKVKSPEYDKQEGKNPLLLVKKDFLDSLRLITRERGYSENLLCDQRDHASDPRGKRGRISLYYPECSGAEFHLLWLFRKRCRAGSHSRRDPGRSGSLQDQWKQYIPAHRRAWILSDPAGNFIPAVRESLYPVRDAGGVYCIDPACCLRVFHLCHFLYPETDAR